MTTNSSTSKAKKAPFRARADDPATLYERYTVLYKLGEGSFGRVNACVHKETAEIHAVKVLCMCKTSGSVCSRRHQDAQQEFCMWRQITGSKHVVTLLDSIFTERYTYFVMEKCDCSLVEMRDAQFEEAYLFNKIFPQMLLGVQHLHSNNILHRDIKPTNFLLSSSGTVKLADFGCCIELGQEIQGIAGTLPYMSPEMVEGSTYGLETDIWSFGAAVYLLLYGEHPYMLKKTPKMGEEGRKRNKQEEKQAIMSAIVSNNPKPRFKSSKKWQYKRSTPARRFLQAIMQHDIAHRPDAAKCHDLFEFYQQMQHAYPDEASVGEGVEHVEQPHTTCIASFPDGRSLFACAEHLTTHYSTHDEESHEHFSTKGKHKISRLSTAASLGDASLTSHESRSRRNLIQL